MTMAEIVYLLCGLASAGCALLVVREYRRSRSRLLLWMSLAFVGLTLGNALIFVDFVLVPGISFGLARAVLAFVSTTVLALGLLWDGD